MELTKLSGYDYNEMMKDLSRLQQAYPFLHNEFIGESVLGNKIPALRMGTGPKEVHYNASCHANEWITTPLLLKFVEEVAEAYSLGQTYHGQNVVTLIAQTSLWVIPMVNPDGVNLVQNGLTADHPYYEKLLEWNQGSFNFQNWKANIRGVDLNDQFPAHWEEERDRRAVTGPGMRDYAGTAPLSEPEAIAVTHFTQNKDFQLVIALHSQGQEIYWNYRDLEPKNAEDIAQRFASVSGYVPVKLTGSDAGYKDWFIQEFRRPGFTVEVGLGTNPLPILQFPEIYKEVAGILLEGLLV